MHLHGFFFRMDSKGDGVRDTLYAPAQRRMGVTEVMNPFETMSLAWRPTRPGNWIYHCHYASHLSHHVALDTEKGALDSTMLAPPHVRSAAPDVRARDGHQRRAEGSAGDGRPDGRAAIRHRPAREA